MSDDPFAKYGGAAVDDASDPFAKYGGAETSQAAPAKASLMPAGGYGSGPDTSTLSSRAGQYWRALTNPVGEGLKPANSPMGAVQQIGGQAIAGAAAIPNMLLHPIDTLHKIQPFVTEADGNPISAAVKPFMDAGSGLMKGNLLPAENLVGQTLGAVEGGRLGAAGLSKVMPAGLPTFKPKSSSAIVSPEEAAARNLTNAINPHPSRAQDYIKAAQEEVPNVLDYAKRTGNPLNTQLEFSKAAEGNAIESRAHYTDNVLGPNAEHRLPAPNGYGGKAYAPTGENPQPTTSLQDIDDRIVQINKDLDIHKANPGDVRPGLASKADLLAEKQQLTGMLHDSLSDLTGIAPQDIANLRQRVGRSWELANDTNQAVTGRGLAENRPGGGTGPHIPHGLGDIAVQGINKLRGGPTAIGDRAFQKALKDFTAQSEPLPQVVGPKTAPAQPVAPPANTVTQPRPLNRAAAQRYYDMAQGDTARARELAAADGWKF